MYHYGQTSETELRVKQKTPNNVLHSRDEKLSVFPQFEAIDMVSDADI